VAHAIIAFPFKRLTPLKCTRPIRRKNDSMPSDLTPRTYDELRARLGAPLIEKDVPEPSPSRKGETERVITFEPLPGSRVVTEHVANETRVLIWDCANGPVLSGNCIATGSVERDEYYLVNVCQRHHGRPASDLAT
jgi:hypothetical protein